jgi:hypothetical protein
LKINATAIDFRPNVGRVLNRPFIPASPDQVSNIIERVLSFSDPEVEAQLACLRDEFAHRHPNLERSWLRQFEKVKAYLSNETSLAPGRRLLIGAFFTGEYAVESVALFNPSIVPHPDQTDLGPEDLRFILTLRAIGEGHISSIEFRSGVVRSDHSIEMDHAAGLVTAPAKIMVEMPPGTTSCQFSVSDGTYTFAVDGIQTMNGRQYTYRMYTSLAGAALAQQLHAVTGSR